MQIHTHKYKFHKLIFRQHYNRFAIIFSSIVLDACIVLCLQIYVCTVLTISLAWSLRFTPNQRVYLLSILTLMVSSELVVELIRLFSFSNVVLSSLSVLGNLVPPTVLPLSLVAVTCLIYFRTSTLSSRFSIICAIFLACLPLSISSRI